MLVILGSIIVAFVLATLTEIALGITSSIGCFITGAIYGLVTITVAFRLIRD